MVARWEADDVPPDTLSRRGCFMVVRLSENWKDGIQPQMNTDKRRLRKEVEGREPKTPSFFHLRLSVFICG